MSRRSPDTTITNCLTCPAFDLPTPAGSVAGWWFIPWSNVDGLSHWLCDIRGGSGTSTIFQILKFTDNKLYGGWKSGGTAYWAFTPAVALQQNKWNHVGVTWDASGNTVLYVNGQEIASNSTLTTWPTHGADNPFTLNNNSHPANQVASSGTKIGPFAIYSATLSGADMVALYQGCNPVSVRSEHLFSFWPLFGLLSPDPDLTGRNSAMTPSNMVADAGAPLALFTTPSPPPLLSADASFSPGQQSATWTDPAPLDSVSKTVSFLQQSSSWTAPVPSDTASSLWQAGQQSATWTDPLPAFAGGGSVSTGFQSVVWSAPGASGSGSAVENAGGAIATWMGHAPSFLVGTTVAMSAAAASWSAPAPVDTGDAEDEAVAPGAHWTAPPMGSFPSRSVPASPNSATWSATAPAVTSESALRVGPNSAVWEARIPAYTPSDCPCPYTVINWIIKL